LSARWSWWRRSLLGGWRGLRASERRRHSLAPSAPTGRAATPVERAASRSRDTRRAGPRWPRPDRRAPPDAHLATRLRHAAPVARAVIRTRSVGSAGAPSCPIFHERSVVRIVPATCRPSRPCRPCHPRLRVPHRHRRHRPCHREPSPRRHDTRGRPPDACARRAWHDDERASRAWAYPVPSSSSSPQSGCDDATRDPSSGAISARHDRRGCFGSHGGARAREARGVARPGPRGGPGTHDPTETAHTLEWSADGRSPFFPVRVVANGRLTETARDVGPGARRRRVASSRSA
jgi:hypothetical protein